MNDTKTNGRSRLKRTIRACSARGKALKRTGSKIAASRLAKFCPPPGRRRKPNSAGHERCELCLGLGETYTYPMRSIGQVTRSHQCKRCGGSGEVRVGTRNPQRPSPRSRGAAAGRKPNASRTGLLDVVAGRAGLEYRTYSPGDGQTRYKFFEAGKAPGDYFGGNGVHTALGRAKAIAFAEEYEAGAAHARTPRDAPVYLPTGRLTMADVKRASRERNQRVGHTSGADFFSRGNSKFFGPERFHGPYRGPGGIFFVTANKAGNLVRQLLPNGAIETVARNLTFDTAEDAKDHAKQLAKRGTGARDR